MGFDERERDRYARAGLVEQAGDLLAELRGHPGILALLVLLVGGGLVMLLTRPAVAGIEELRAGDCLWIHAADAQPGTPGARATGTPAGAVQALYARGAERAACDGSHSHEVVAVFALEGASDSPYPGAAVLDERRAACATAFGDWAAGAAADPPLELVTAVPPATAWTDGVRAGACLAARSDGQFLAGPARGRAP